MELHSISVDEDLKNAAKQVEVFAISLYLDLLFPPHNLSPFSFYPSFQLRAETYLVH